MYEKVHDSSHSYRNLCRFDRVFNYAEGRRAGIITDETEPIYAKRDGLQKP